MSTDPTVRSGPKAAAPFKTPHSQSTPMASESPTPAAALPPRPNPLKRLYLWVLHWAETPYGTPALACISFAESSFFPIPPDVLQIALSVSQPKKSFYYAAVSAAASVAGGVAGYYIGLLLWSMVGGFFLRYVPGFSEQNMATVHDLYHGNAFLAIFMAAFTPIPYKVFTVSAGIFQVPIWTLVLASALGRSGRFFLVATVIYFFGPSVKHVLDKYLELATILLGTMVVAGFVAVKYLF